VTYAAVDQTRQADFPTEIDFGVKNLSGNERTERQQDKLHAATLFAQGRLQYRRRNFEQSLQHFQRAWRYDQSVVSITNELIPLAINLKRDSVAARYAELALETSNLDPQALGRIAVLLTKNQRYDGALEAYQRLLASKPKNRIFPLYFINPIILNKYQEIFFYGHLFLKHRIHQLGIKEIHLI